MKTRRSRTSSPRLPDLTRRLRKESRKITGPREAVLNILRRHTRPLSAREIFQALPSRDCDLATVYRSLHLLEEMRMVKRFDLGNGGARFELLPEGDDGHHHHLVCTNCSDVLEIEGCFPVELEQTIAHQSGFKAVTHKLEFFGVCPRCQ
jgi:Fur family transcriptional regulator, ferric uptake regulator